MPAYVLVDSQVTDPQKYEDYKKLTPASIEAYGGRFLARGGALEVLEGDWKPTRVIVVEFPTLEDARRWYEGPEYTAARKVREGAAHMNMVVVQGT